VGVYCVYFHLFSPIFGNRRLFRLLRLFPRARLVNGPVVLGVSDADLVNSAVGLGAFGVLSVNSAVGLVNSGNGLVNLVNSIGGLGNSVNRSGVPGQFALRAFFASEQFAFCLSGGFALIASGRPGQFAFRASR
jgi:hypothetical protein